MIARALAAAALAAALAAPGGAGAVPSSPFTQDPLGPISDVTSAWHLYQPAADFCVKPNVFEASGNSENAATGADPVCAASGFGSGDTGLYKGHVEAPALCGGCRRLFLDYSKIPAENSPGYYYARGHTYFHIQSFNPTYTIEPTAHSPNIKNLSNDKLIAPAGSTQKQFFGGFDLHAMTYTGDTANFAHTKVQGPYYAGPWYLSQSGQRITGAYLDVTVGDYEPLPDPALNEIGYSSFFNSGEATCPDNAPFASAYKDGNYYYGGCANWGGGSAGLVNPYA